MSEPVAGERALIRSDREDRHASIGVGGRPIARRVGFGRRKIADHGPKAWLAIGMTAAWKRSATSRLANSSSGKYFFTPLWSVHSLLGKPTHLLLFFSRSVGTAAAIVNCLEKPFIYKRLAPNASSRLTPGRSRFFVSDLRPGAPRLRSLEN
jgi:hypothetical protein